MGAQSNFGASFHICSFWPSDPPRIAVVSVACMPVGHGTWKASEPLSDLDQLLSVAKYDPNVNAKQVVSVCNTQQRLVYPLPHTPATRCPRWDAPPWPRWEVSGRMLHQEKYSDLKDFFSADGGDCGDKRVARSLGRWRVV